MSLAIYVDQPNHMDYIPKILDFLSLKIEDSFFVYSDIDAPDSPYSVASLNVYNILNDFNDKILFLNVKDYNRLSKIYKGECYIFTTKEDLLNIEKKNFIPTKTTFIIKHNNELRNIKNAELQSIFR